VLNTSVPATWTGGNIIVTYKYYKIKIGMKGIWMNVGEKSTRENNEAWLIPEISVLIIVDCIVRTG